jgi:hypothetical protein
MGCTTVHDHPGIATDFFLVAGCGFRSWPTWLKEWGILRSPRTVVISP